MRKLEYVDLASCLDDLRGPRGIDFMHWDTIGKGNMQSRSTPNGVFASASSMATLTMFRSPTTTEAEV